jgi:hypothetical protein
MNCIFCKYESCSSRSVEHIIPESIGNSKHVLPRGVVCDRCNNYFARKVEQPLLETKYFRERCFRARIPNKKGNLPRVQGIHLQSGVVIDISPNVDNDEIAVGAAHEKDEKQWIESIQSSTSGIFLIERPDEPDERLVSRFLAKVALEALCLRILEVQGGIQEIIEKTELDSIRKYAREGGTSCWGFHKRLLYPENLIFTAKDEDAYEVLHEWTFVYTSFNELYFVLGLFGIEYAINLGGPEISGYEDWLEQNGLKSPLYLRSEGPLDLNKGFTSK